MGSTPNNTLNFDLKPSDYHTTKAKEGMFESLETDERILGRRAGAVRVVTIGPGQPLFRFASVKDGDWKWDGAWWTTKLGLFHVLRRAASAERRAPSPSFSPNRNITAVARDYSAVLLAWNAMDVIGWATVRPDRYVKCFMGFGLPKFNAHESYAEANIQLCIPNLSVNKVSVRDQYFTPVKPCPVRAFDVSVLNRLADAVLLENSYLHKQM